MFYCREEELRTMNCRYERGSFECVVIYGRRRVGKTALVNEFCKDMEYQVLGCESPLYGRRTAQFKIQALTYRESTAFYPELSLDNQALLYGVTGGIPHYINKLDVEHDLDEALLENLFDPTGYLFEEPENLLKQELREPAIYNSVISAIAGGALPA